MQKEGIYLRYDKSLIQISRFRATIAIGGWHEFVLPVCKTACCVSDVDNNSTKHTYLSGEYHPKHNPGIIYASCMMHICMCACKYVCICMYACVCICMYMYVYMNEYVCIRMHMYVCVCILYVFISVYGIERPK